MLIEMILGTGLIVAGAAAARVLFRPRPVAPKARAQRAPRGLQVGDVLLHANEEYWLAGALELQEDGLVCRLFPAPGPSPRWVAQLDPEGRDLAVLTPTEEVPDGQVPEALPIAGRRLTLACRGRAEVEAEGEHLPPTRRKAGYTMLSDRAGKLLVVVDFERGSRLSLLGERVASHHLDILPGGDAG